MLSDRLRLTGKAEFFRFTRVTSIYNGHLKTSGFYGSLTASYFQGTASSNFPLALNVPYDHGENRSCPPLFKEEVPRRGGGVFVIYSFLIMKM